MTKILWISRCGCVLLAAGLLMATPGAAQDTSSANSKSTAVSQTVEDVLHRMSDQAEIIFIGQVVAIRPHDEGTGAAGFVEIDFLVEQAIRGGQTGGTYTLREWGGLWAGNANRYRAGQLLLMMLHAPGAAGMSSPVGGMDGAIPIRGAGDASQPGAASAGATVVVADLRWLGAKLLHPVSYRLQSALSPTPLLVSQQMMAGPKAPVVNLMSPVDDTSSRASIPAQQASVETVVKLLSSWQKVTTDVH